MSLIQLKNVSKSFGDLHVLRNVSLEIPEGETTAIIGPSGTGKSVSLKHIVGLLRPDTGQVLCFGTDMASASEKEIYAARRRMGMLFQDGALFDSRVWPTISPSPWSMRQNCPKSSDWNESMPNWKWSVYPIRRRAIGLVGSTREWFGQPLSWNQKSSCSTNPTVATHTSDDQLICDMKESLGIRSS